MTILRDEKLKIIMVIVSFLLKELFICKLFSFNLQLEMRARDRGSPPLISANTFTLHIVVLRNLNCPSFDNLPKEIEINQTTTGPIMTVKVTDSDDSVRSLVLFQIYIYILFY